MKPVPNRASTPLFDAGLLRLGISSEATNLLGALGGMRGYVRYRTDTRRHGGTIGASLGTRIAERPRSLLQSYTETPVLPNSHTAQNRLLASLPQPEKESWHPHLEFVDMPLGQVIHEPGAGLDFAFFPLTSIVSLLYVMENGASAEIAVVGNDGMVGVPLFMGGDTTTSRAVVQCAGQGYRLPASVLKSAIRRNPAAHRVLLLYTQALLTQMAQTAVCNRHHTLHQQFCRWLLLSLDRLPGNELVMTQELIANMLGVRRQGVNEVAAKLQAHGAIDYKRGRIQVLERAKLEACSCECYSVVARECARLLPSAVRRSNL